MIIRRLSGRLSGPSDATGHDWWYVREGIYLDILSAPIHPTTSTQQSQNTWTFCLYYCEVYSRRLESLASSDTGQPDDFRDGSDR